ncbi:nucleosome assembly protein [Candida orthopsilosis Co 90-125]|uniref:Nucleosome assembly protein n=1 Tax=Candida orthopsilosis (strain 90-125) TaxID=1136231 RepID=H8WVG9_CANO9|nr:nucleosome assembly protein [Candida orthopsilosis Co 90-125]CCG20441.1 nucleosome assembly protein [Candida orthopsilosis Co 90-125]
MSEPIKKKNGDISKAPTPQNTPASVTNSYLKSQPPTVPTIEEGNENKINQTLANNPVLLSMIQGKLGDLVGKNSGYVANLPPAVKNRIYGLKSIQQQQMKLETEFQKELLELEKRYFKKYEPLYAKRKEVIVGDVEPTEQEIEEGKALEEKDEEEDEEDDDENKEQQEEEESAVGKDARGIPGFWLTALENLSTVSETITDKDSEILEHLIDIRMQYLSTPGFELIFEFGENEYLSNSILTKTYHYQAELGYSGDFVYDHATGCEINWKSKEKNPTINIERRKQRNKTTKQTRTIEKITPTESFFNFFDPPKPPKVEEDEAEDDEREDEDEDEDEDLEARLELDYQLGEEIKDRLIPRAVDWFTGDAVDFAYPDEFDGDEEGEFSDEEGEEEDDDDDEEDDDEDGQDGQGEKQPPAECKQQ